MAKVPLTQSLRKEYETLFNTCAIRPERVGDIEKICNRMLADKARYLAVASDLGIPWYFVGAIHNMESGGSFQKHLHNGDPLTQRTVHVPAGRPNKGDPPFTWEQSAEDALAMRGLGAQTDWSLAGMLYQLEGYNGWGYRLYHSHVLSPYLWSFSEHYKSGKYVSDGTWSDTAVSKQCGGAVLLRRLAETKQIEPDGAPSASGAAAGESEPLIVKYSTEKAHDPAVVQSAKNLQNWLNTFPGVFVKPDGIPGDLTSDAYKKITGSYLPGDPRG